MDIVADFRTTEHDGHFQVNAKPDHAHPWCHHVSQFSRCGKFCERTGQENVLFCQTHLGMPGLAYL